MPCNSRIGMKASRCSFTQSTTRTTRSIRAFPRGHVNLRRTLTSPADIFLRRPSPIADVPHLHILSSSLTFVAPLSTVASRLRCEATQACESRPSHAGTESCRAMRCSDTLTFSHLLSSSTPLFSLLFPVCSARPRQLLSITASDAIAYVGGKLQSDALAWSYHRRPLRVWTPKRCKRPCKGP